jgi:hypothetical protein
MTLVAPDIAASLLRGAGTSSSAVPNTLTNSSSRSASLTRLYASA